MEKFRVKKADIMISAAVILIAAIVFICLNVFAGAGSVAIVERDGVVVAELPLDENTTFDVIDGDTVTNTVEIKDGAARVISADCPDKICVHHRAISKNGESIICLPNKVVVTIRSDGAEVDGVAR